MNKMQINKFKILLCFIILSVLSTLIIFSLLLTYGNTYYSNNHNVVHIITQISSSPTPSPNFQVFTDNTIQTSQLSSGNNNKVIVPISYISLSKDNNNFLTYVNPTYGIKIQFPHNWFIEGTNYREGKGGVQIAAFYLPSISEGLPFIRIGMDNLTKEFPERQGKIGTFDYLKKALQGKNSKGFPGLRLIESNLTRTANSNINSSTLAGNHPTFTIIWTYTHPTYGVRKSIEVGTVIGNMGYFIDYTAHIAKFSDYLQIVKRMISSLEIIQNNKNSHHQLQANGQMQQV